MISASRRWDHVFRKVLQTSEEGKVKIVELLKQHVEQAKKHPRDFSHIKLKVLTWAGFTRL